MAGTITPGTLTPSSDRLLLQTSGPGDSLWESALPASVWRGAVPGGIVEVEVEAATARLRSATGAALEDHGEIIGTASLRLSTDGPDFWWVEGTGVSAVRWSLVAPGAGGRARDLPPVTVVVPTYRREKDAVRQARRFAGMTGIVDRVLVIDQGGTLADHAPFVKLLGESTTVELISQDNLGGSGGYARGLDEASSRPGSAVLLTDDDAALSEESLRRMRLLQALSPIPTIVGTGLRSRRGDGDLLAHSEAIRRRDFWWTAADGMTGPVGVAASSPDAWSALALRRDADYAGWWGALLPPGAIDRLGLPAPFFLKWDDAVFGLRARSAGYGIVVLPGASVRHPPWTSHNSLMTWSSLLLHRNRLATAAAYGASRGAIVSSLLHQIKHILAGHHLTAELWAEGIDQFRGGPGTWLGSDLREARARGQAVVDAFAAECPASALTEESPGEIADGIRPGAPQALLSAVLTILHPHAVRSVVEVRPRDLSWRTTLGADLVLVRRRNGTVVRTLLNDGRRGRRLVARTLLQHADLALRWGSLRRAYARALPLTTRPESWRRVFTGAPDPTTRKDS